MRTYVFYHNADFDGVCSAALFLKKWKEVSSASEPLILHSEPVTYGINYGDKFPWDILKPEDHVFMVDFSLPMEDMKRLNDTVAQFTWIDHHKTAIGASAEVGFTPSKGVSCDITQAACELVWWYLFPSERELHPVVKLLGRYDVWDHSDPDTLPFQYGMRAHVPLDPHDPHWADLLRKETEYSALAWFYRIMDKGRIILKYETKTNEKMALKRAFPAMLGDVRLIVLNHSLAGSKLFDAVFDPEKHDAMLVYSMNGKGEYAGSMYSPEGGIDVGAICAKLGGGGHTHAAGFRVKEIPFTLIEE